VAQQSCNRNPGSNQRLKIFSVKESQIVNILGISGQLFSRTTEACSLLWYIKKWEHGLKVSSQKMGPLWMWFYWRCDYILEKSFADLIKDFEMRSPWFISMDAQFNVQCLQKRKAEEDLGSVKSMWRQRQRLEWCSHKEYWQPPEVGRSNEWFSPTLDPPLDALEGARPCPQLDFGFHSSKTLRE
jgi:hypothetical protein